MEAQKRPHIILGIILSLVVLGLPLLKYTGIDLGIELSLLEAFGVVFFAWSVWLLAENNALGWWVSLIGVALYIVIFYQARLYGEILIQAFFFVTGIQGIYLWLKGGEGSSEKPISKVSQRVVFISVIAAIVCFFILRLVLIKLNGAAPIWDAATTVIAFVAQIYLINRWIENWYLWIVVDIIYLPLYLSRGLYFTSVMYAFLLILSIQGLLNFKRLYHSQADI